MGWIWANKLNPEKIMLICVPGSHVLHRRPALDRVALHWKGQVRVLGGEPGFKTATEVQAASVARSSIVKLF